MVGRRSDESYRDDVEDVVAGTVPYHARTGVEATWRWRHCHVPCCNLTMVKIATTKKSIFQSTLKRNSVHTSYSWSTLGGSIGRSATAGALFIVASVLHGMRSIFTVLAKGTNSHFPFHPAAAFMMSEILALVLSLVGTMVLGRGTADLKAFKLGTFMMMSIPALLITVADEIAMICLENMDAATFQTLSNLKIFTTTILFRVLTGVPITLEQYTALLMLFFGSCLAMANVCLLYTSPSPRDRG